LGDPENSKIIGVRRGGLRVFTWYGVGGRTKEGLLRREISRTLAKRERKGNLRGWVVGRA